MRLNQTSNITLDMALFTLSRSTLATSTRPAAVAPRAPLVYGNTPTTERTSSFHCPMPDIQRLARTRLGARIPAPQTWIVRGRIREATGAFGLDAAHASHEDADRYAERPGPAPPRSRAFSIHRDNMHGGLPQRHKARRCSGRDPGWILEGSLGRELRDAPRQTACEAVGRGEEGVNNDATKVCDALGLSVADKDSEGAGKEREFSMERSCVGLQVVLFMSKARVGVRHAYVDNRIEYAAYTGTASIPRATSSDASTHCVGMLLHGA